MHLILLLFLVLATETGIASAQLCSPGQKQVGETCVLCESGTFSTDGNSTSCTPCAFGRYADYGASQCTECAPGTFTDLIASASCKHCPAGRFTANAESVGCTPCQPGRFSSFEGSFECQQCAIGTYADSDGQTSCSTCFDNYFAPNLGSTACNNCEAGFVNLLDHSGCGPDDCESGTYPVDGSTCQQCDENEVRESGQRGGCNTCPAGSFAMDSTYCVECTIGRYSIGGVGGGSCTLCPAGTFGNVTGASTCYDCLTTEYSSAGSTFCSSCSTGHVQNTAGDGCVVIPEPSPTPSPSPEPTPEPVACPEPATSSAHSRHMLPSFATTITCFLFFVFVVFSSL